MTAPERDAGRTGRRPEAAGDPLHYWLAIALCLAAAASFLVLALVDPHLALLPPPANPTPCHLPCL